MTGILVDPTTCAIFSSAFLVGLYIDWPNETHTATNAYTFIHLVIVWACLVLVAFAPACFSMNTADWNWPPNRRKPAPNPQGGPPRNQWPRAMRFSYLNQR